MWHLYKTLQPLNNGNVPLKVITLFSVIPQRFVPYHPIGFLRTSPAALKVAKALVSAQTIASLGGDVLKSRWSCLLHPSFISRIEGNVKERTLLLKKGRFPGWWGLWVGYSKLINELIAAATGALLCCRPSLLLHCNKWRRRVLLFSIHDITLKTVFRQFHFVILCFFFRSVCVIARSCYGKLKSVETILRLAVF